MAKALPKNRYSKVCTPSHTIRTLKEARPKIINRYYRALICDFLSFNLSLSLFLFAEQEALLVGVSRLGDAAEPQNRRQAFGASEVISRKASKILWFSVGCEFHTLKPFG